MQATMKSAYFKKALSPTVSWKAGMSSVARRTAPVTRAVVMPNPFSGSEGETLVFRADGQSVKMRDVIDGKLCWEQARNLLSLEPQFKASGYRLVTLSIGNSEGGKLFCKEVPFPSDLLYLDPERKVYRTLKLKDGMFSFFQGPAAVEAWMRKDMKGLEGALKSYKMVVPSDMDVVTQQGGLYVFNEQQVLYAYEDPGVGAHAPNAEILAACCSVSSPNATPASVIDIPPPPPARRF
ncbi:hypothetical protein CEUSTIGMA_g4381.t1 [Chlamydomonas eustigma]|uniref:Uncharacterized protein n=1 Tax=Chlamydomonas eustigma TaxID=1157962 RepID=A0A250X1G1_9CHLO|nr:hypothetical protein CEUSTIGMA_g4381.t1 [Chlamydomonas eustigma]|eukprot:GAX76934.1 hypothetical protein CEUSTIGMA_g4381.t1 [Chlamydomonas eustigma]